MLACVCVLGRWNSCNVCVTIHNTCNSTQSKKTKSRDRTSSHSGDDSMTRTPSNSGPSGGVGLTNRSGDLEDSGNCTGNSKSRQKKKKKMQKVRHSHFQPRFWSWGTVLI